MVNWHSLTFHDLHPMRNKNLHDVSTSTWVADEQTVLSWQDISSNGLEGYIKDELVNEPKTEFTWLKQNTCVLCAEVIVSKLIFLFEFHLMFARDWFRAHRDHSILRQLSRFGSWFFCPIPQPMYVTSSSTPPPLQVSCMGPPGEQGPCKDSSAAALVPASIKCETWLIPSS